MASVKSARWLEATARAVTLTAACMPFTSFAQTAAGPDTGAEQRQRLIEQIERIQAQDADSPDLIEPLSALASVLQEDGDCDFALAMREQARAIIRQSRGLHSMEEASLIRQSMLMEAARGNAERAWNLEQELLTAISTGTAIPWPEAARRGCAATQCAP
jgi:hypothetical protein